MAIPKEIGGGVDYLFNNLGSVSNENLRHIVKVQSWVRGWLARRHYNRMVKTLNKRKNICKEILGSEETYASSLDVLVSHYLNTFKKETNILKPAKREEIFGNVESILNMSKQLVSRLRHRLLDWDQSVESQKIADIFLELVAPSLNLYSVYCSKYDKSIQALMEQKIEDPKSSFSIVIAKCKETSKSGMDIHALLIMPVQRLPRYKMFFEQLLDLTPKDHGDYLSIKEVLDKILFQANEANRVLKLRQSTEKLEALQKRFVGKNVPVLATTGRLFLKEGELIKLCRKDEQKRMFWLMSDLLIYGTETATGSYKCHRAIVLPPNTTKITDLPDKSNLKNAFQIVTQAKSFIVFTPSKQEKTEWLTSFETVIDGTAANTNAPGTPTADKGKQNALVKSDSESQFVAPVWVQDKEENNCMLCNVGFTVIRRRHHCRKCGLLVCNGCSEQRFVLPGLGNQRVCDTCYEELSGKKLVKKKNKSRGNNAPPKENGYILPQNLALIVFSYLAEPDLIASMQVCKYWKRLLEAEDFWKNLYEARIGRLNRVKLSPELSWKVYFFSKQASEGRWASKKLTQRRKFKGNTNWMFDFFNWIDHAKHTTPRTQQHDTYSDL
eukprot:TRINITY_DN402_c0_g2_i4.p1 TRINITY_DN402_c0_g2~~TRINITY_DN402_c0_g2_i4.p1  ORF type:complete len:610 (+),score=94.76 TRINITY_DN402_c0_g2_i4:235-2064(+)